MPMLLLSAERFRGFSLLQSAVALAVMALGMLFLVPRLDDLIDEAYRAHVKAVGSAIQVSAHTFHKVWLTDRNSRLLIDMKMTESGWPLGRKEDVDASSEVTGAERCTGLWTSLLDIEVPTLTSGDSLSADFRVEEVEGRCRYYHQLSGNRYYIEYDAANGRVSWKIR